MFRLRIVEGVCAELDDFNVCFLVEIACVFCWEIVFLCWKKSVLSLKVVCVCATKLCVFRLRIVDGICAELDGFNVCFLVEIGCVFCWEIVCCVE